MAERGALGIACGAAGVLDVDRIIELLLTLALGEGCGADLRRHRRDIAPGVHARRTRSSPSLMTARRSGNFPALS